MGDHAKPRPVHTEHLLDQSTVVADNAGALQLFRAPTVLDGSGNHKRLPHRIHWSEIRVGDKLLAFRTQDLDGGARVVDVLQFWHVLGVADDEYRIEINNIVGSAGDGEFVHDRIAGLLGLEPGERTDGR